MLQVIDHTVAGSMIAHPPGARRFQLACYFDFPLASLLSRVSYKGIVRIVFVQKVSNNLCSLCFLYPIRSGTRQSQNIIFLNFKISHNLDFSSRLFALFQISLPISTFTNLAQGYLKASPYHSLYSLFLKHHV